MGITGSSITAAYNLLKPGNPAFAQQIKSVADIPALGHDLTTIPAIAPTCTQTGLTEGYFCIRCDYTIPQETVDALGHAYLDGVCTRCGAADPFYSDALIEIFPLSLYVKPGQPVVIPVTITGGADIAGFTLTVSTDPGLTLTRAQKGELLQSADGSLVNNLAKGIVNWTSTEEIAADGELLLLTFAVEETAAMNERLGIRLRLKDDKPTNMADAEGEAVSVRFVDGVLIVSPVLFGDTNSDEEINSADAVRLVRSIVELEELSDTEFLAADVSHDGDVTSSDAIILTRYLAGLVERLDLVPISNRRARQNVEEEVAICVSTVTGIPGDTVTVPVTISGNTGFAGFTWEITCSEALSITKIEKGGLLTHIRRRISDHQS